MATLLPKVETKVSTEAAQSFISEYYKTLNVESARNTIASFYVQPSPSNPIAADISLNGNVVASPAEMQVLFETQMPKAHYEPQSFDCHVLNPNYCIDARDGEFIPDATGKKASFLLAVSGYVKYGEARDAMRGFTENFVLVPNFNSGINNLNGMGWLIQSQNFRIVL